MGKRDKFYPYEKGGGAEKVLSHAEVGRGGGGGGARHILTWKLEVLTRLKGAQPNFHPKMGGGAQKSYRLEGWRGGGTKIP